MSNYTGISDPYQLDRTGVSLELPAVLPRPVEAANDPFVVDLSDPSLLAPPSAVSTWATASPPPFGSWPWTAWTADGDADSPCRAWSPARFRDGVRGLDQMLAVSAIVLDVGGVAQDHVPFLTYFDCMALAWTGRVTGDDHARTRVLLPLATPIAVPDYLRLRGLLNAEYERRGQPFVAVGPGELCRAFLAEDPVRWSGSGHIPWDPAHLLKDDPDYDTKVLENLQVEPLGPYFDRALNRAERRATGQERPVPIPWPTWSSKLSGGFWPGEHVVVGPTGAGKTQLALQIALHAAKEGCPVVYVSLELSAEEVATRVAGIETGLPWSGLSTGRDVALVAAARRALPPELPALPFHVLTASPYGYSYDDLLPVCSALTRQYSYVLKDAQGLPRRPLLVVLDFLQLVASPEGLERQSLRERIQQAAYRVRAAARDLDVVVLVVSATAREHYEKLRQGREAAPFTLIGLGKESGEIEYGADSLAVLCVEPPDSELQAAVADGRLVHVAVPKIRAGKAGWGGSLVFDGGSFRELDPAELPLDLSKEAGVFLAGADEPAGGPAGGPAYDPDLDLSE